MFTGIIEELGTIEKISAKGNTLKISICAKKVMADMKLGDSVAVNGVCLTVTSFNHDTFTVDVMPETFHHTALSDFKQGTLINLERAMAANGRFGGHFVTGHVDGVGKIVKKKRNENALEVTIRLPNKENLFLLPKGSIAIDGTSLTIFGIEGDVITISLIPHTAKETILGMKQVGERVNIEFDLLAKYVHSMVAHSSPSRKKNDITTEFLEKAGFM